MRAEFDLSEVRNLRCENLGFLVYLDLFHTVWNFLVGLAHMTGAELTLSRISPTNCILSEAQRAGVFDQYSKMCCNYVPFSDEVIGFLKGLRLKGIPDWVSFYPGLTQSSGMDG